MKLLNEYFDSEIIKRVEQRKTFKKEIPDMLDIFLDSYESQNIEIDMKFIR